MELTNESPLRTSAKIFSKKQETVKVANYEKKMGYVQAQPHTHFRLKQESDRKKLLQAIESVSDVVGPITAKYDYGRKYNADIILRRKSDSDKAEPIGKIHLLLFDRPKRYDIKSYYIQLHFFQFVNDALFDKVKEIVTRFFNDLPPSSDSYISAHTNSARRTNKMNKANKLNKTIKSSNVMRPQTLLNPQSSSPKIDDSEIL